MKRTALVVLCLSLIPVEAQAISRYNSTSMTCANVKATVRREGAVILRWRSKYNPSLPLYGRFVANGSFCEASTRPETRYVPTSDRKSCAVLECKYYDPDDDFLFRFGRD